MQITSEQKNNFVIGVYSDRPEWANNVVSNLGPIPDPGLGVVKYEIFIAPTSAVSGALKKEYDLLIADADATTMGGMGLSRQMHLECDPCPPIILAISRVADEWLASWSQVTAVVATPIDPIEVAKVVAGILRPSAVS